MIWLALLIIKIQGEVYSNSTEIWIGLQYGLQQNGQPGACLKAFPGLQTNYNIFITSLSSTELFPKLQSFQSFINTLTSFVNLCQFQQLADSIFGIYKWSVLQPILITLASNLILFSQLASYLQIAIQGGFYYNIGLYMGQLISLVFGFYI
jgi:hypothetical protein